MYDRLCVELKRVPRHTTKLLVLGGALLAAGCDSMLEPEAGQKAGSALAGAQDATATAPKLRVATRALAIAMQDRAVRAAVRDGLRDSPWAQHKVVLQEFLSTPEGAAVLQAAARAAGHEPAEFAALLAELPPMDFYVPSRETRRTWQGTPNVIVLASMDPDAKDGIGFGTDGQELAMPLVRGNNGTAMLLIHPAESKLPRSRPQARGKGDVIQTAQDGELAERLVWYYPSGDSVVVDVETARAGRDPRFSVAGAAGAQSGTGMTQTGTIRTSSVSPTPVNPTPSTYAYLDHFDINFGDGWGNVELRMDARFYGPAGDYLGFARYSNDDVAENGSQSPGIALIAHIPPVDSDARINIDVWEDDSNNNDNYGNRNLFWFDRDQARSVYKGSAHTADVELNWVARARPQLARYTLDGVWMEVGYTSQAVVIARDQYGYKLLNQQHSVSSWWTGNAYVATVSPAGGAYATVYGNGVGQTTLSAQISGTSTVVSAPVTVDEPYVPPCDPYDPYCVQ